MAQPRGAGTPQTVRLPAELLERTDRYAARLESELNLSLSRSDALRRLLTLALKVADDTPARSDPEGQGTPRELGRAQSRLRLTSSGARVLTYRNEFVRSIAKTYQPPGSCAAATGGSGTQSSP